VFLEGWYLHKCVALGDEVIRLIKTTATEWRTFLFRGSVKIGRVLKELSCRSGSDLSITILSNRDLKASRRTYRLWYSVSAVRGGAGRAGGPSIRHQRAPAWSHAFVAKGVEFVTYSAAAIAGSRGKLVYSSVDRRTMHALFVDHPPPPPDKRRQIKCGRTEMLLLQSIKFLLLPPQPQRTSIRPVGSERVAGAFATISVVWSIVERRAIIQHPAAAAVVLPLSATICHRGAGTRHWGLVRQSSTSADGTTRHIRSVTQDETWYMTSKGRGRGERRNVVGPV